MFKEILGALSKTPRRVWDVLTDPIRRSHLVFQTLLVVGSGWLVTGDVVIGIKFLVVYFVVYEFVLEPISKWLVKKGWKSLTGPYWERGPAEGEEFKNP